jgi:hypothetical protein
MQRRDRHDDSNIMARAKSKRAIIEDLASKYNIHLKVEKK